MPRGSPSQFTYTNIGAQIDAIQQSGHCRFQSAASDYFSRRVSLWLAASLGITVVELFRTGFFRSIFFCEANAVFAVVFFCAIVLLPFEAIRNMDQGESGLRFYI